ncbi:MAG: hypothetical protein AAFU61_05530 [Pseudomonadota bacterium]
MSRFLPPAGARRAALALAALLGLSACASVSSTPVSTETVDNSYRLYSIQWQDTDVVTGVAVKLRPAGDGTLICGAFAATGNDFERREIEQQVAGGAAVVHDGLVVKRGLAGFAGPYEGMRLRGRPANCLRSSLAWQPDFSDPLLITLNAPRVVTQ